MSIDEINVVLKQIENIMTIDSVTSCYDQRMQLTRLVNEYLENNNDNESEERYWCMAIKMLLQCFHVYDRYDKKIQMWMYNYRYQTKLLMELGLRINGNSRFFFETEKDVFHHLVTRVKNQDHP